MGSKQCGRCGEVVNEAKAFCPGCGNAFVVEEKRTTVTDFDMSNETVRLGNTMYNQLLSDMGLSISKAPNKDVDSPGEPHDAAHAAPPTPQVPNTNAKRNRWLTRATIAALGLLLLLVLGLLVVYLLWPRFA